MSYFRVLSSLFIDFTPIKKQKSSKFPLHAVSETFPPNNSLSKVTTACIFLVDWKILSASCKRCSVCFIRKEI